MSALGQKQTFGVGLPMSALPPEADMRLSAILRNMCHQPELAGAVTLHASKPRSSLKAKDAVSGLDFP